MIGRFIKGRDFIHRQGGACRHHLSHHHFGASRRMMMAASGHHLMTILPHGDFGRGGQTYPRLCGGDRQVLPVAVTSRSLRLEMLLVKFLVTVHAAVDMIAV